MFEVERQAFLEALGIVQYVPRSAINGAAPSPLLPPERLYPAVQPVADSGSAGKPPERQAAKPATDARVAQPATVESTQTDTSESPGSAGLKVHIPQELLAEPTAQDQSPRSQPGADDTVEFCFALLQTPNGIAMLIELGDPGVKDMSAQEHRLLSNILAAIAIPRDQCRFQYFKWPLVNNPRIKQGWPEAKETLQGYLESKLNQQPASTLVLFGELPAKALSVHQQLVSVGDSQIATFQVPSLHEMLVHWQHKAKAWRALAPLRDRKF